MLEALIGVLLLVGALVVAGQPALGVTDLQVTRLGGGVGLLAVAIAGGRAAGSSGVGGDLRHLVVIGAIFGVLGGLGLVLDAMEPAR